MLFYSQDTQITLFGQWHLRGDVMSDDGIGNGCGPEWMPRFIKTALFDWFHEASCNKHDEGYINGGDKERRKHCDKKFLEAMKRDSMRKRGLQRAIRLTQAYAFYYAVRGYGWTAFNYHD